MINESGRAGGNACPLKDLEKAFCLYTPYKELVPYPMTRSEEKRLIKERKKDKNIT